MLSVEDASFAISKRQILLSVEGMVLLSVEDSKFWYHSVEDINLLSVEDIKLQIPLQTNKISIP